MISKIIPVRFDNFKVPCKDMVNHFKFDDLYPCEPDGLSNWALRSLLIFSGDHRVLIDTGFGNKQRTAFFDSFCLNGGYSMQEQLAMYGITSYDITDVILTHLHFDHCGGCLLKNNDSTVAAFPAANLWISKQQWDNALNPLDEEKESLLKENILPLPYYYKIKFVENEGVYLPGIDFRLVSGHTAGQIIPVITIKEKTFLFGADLFPSSAHLDPEINMIYDINASLANKEKIYFIEEAEAKEWIIIFQHDLYFEGCSLKRLNNKTIVDKIPKLAHFM